MTGDNVGEIETQFLVGNDMKKTDVDYFSALFHGVPGCVNELDGAFVKHLDRAKEELDQIELAVLRLGTYELAKRVDVPYRVVINESVELAKTFGASESFKYINGILDKVSQALRMEEIRQYREKGKE